MAGAAITGTEAALRVLDPDREHVLVVCSHDPRSGRPPVSAGRVLEAVRRQLPDAEVLVVDDLHPRLGDVLAAELRTPERWAATFGGAIRFFPPRLRAWRRRHPRSILPAVLWRAGAGVWSPDDMLSLVERAAEACAADLLLGELRAEQQQQDQQSSRASKPRPDTPAPAASPVPWGAFLDPDDAVGEAIRRAWVDLVPAAEKAAHPLGRYRLGPEFSGSLRGFDDGVQRKALRAIVALLADHGAGRYEARRPATEPDRVDGASPWRASIEQSTPSARRLLYWRLPDGQGLELARVALHDDYRYV